jgi:hypothetical protein
MIARSFLNWLIYEIKSLELWVMSKIVFTKDVTA